MRLCFTGGTTEYGPTPDTRLSISSGRVGGVTHSDVADMMVPVLLIATDRIFFVVIFWTNF